MQMGYYSRKNNGYISLYRLLQWKLEKSIPFYRNFPKYLEARLPYTLTFGITDKDGYVISSNNYEDIDEFMKEHTGEDLKFFYVVTKK